MKSPAGRLDIPQSHPSGVAGTWDRCLRDEMERYGRRPTGPRVVRSGVTVTEGDAVVGAETRPNRSLRNSFQCFAGTSG